MAPTIGVNLRVTGHCNQGGRKHMEDMFSVAYQQTEDEKDLEYAYFGIFDGHGGREAASFAKEHLMDSIVSQKKFWSDDDDDVIKAIRDGFISTHYAMWRELEKWPKTLSGLPSTSGTTASIAFIRKGKIYIGHVGDSSVVIGYQNKGETEWKAKSLTRDHKPESEDETDRIKQCGGKVVYKSGVPRVVWNRPRIGHKGPVRRSTHIDEIPFLAVARSLGDLWSYNSSLNQFVVSPEPDVEVIPIEISKHKCLILGTDGLWNMLSPQAAVDVVHSTERHNVLYALHVSSSHNLNWINPSKKLVDTALEKWFSSKLIADNTSVVTLMLDPPGPPRAQVLRKQQVSQIHNVEEQSNHETVPVTSADISSPFVNESLRTLSPHSLATGEENMNGSAYNGAASTGGVVIFTRYPSTIHQNLEVGNNNDRMMSSAQPPPPRYDDYVKDGPSLGMEVNGRVREVGNILHDPGHSVKEPAPSPGDISMEKEERSLPIQNDASNSRGNSPEIQINEVSSSLSESNNSKDNNNLGDEEGLGVNVVVGGKNERLGRRGARNIEVVAKHKECWLLRRRTRSEDRYLSFMSKSGGSVNDVLSDCVTWAATTSKPQVVRGGVRRRLLSTGDLGKGGAWNNNCSQLTTTGRRCCGQHLGLSVGKADRCRTIIAPRRGRSKPLVESCALPTCTVHREMEEVILNEPEVGDASTSSETVVSNDNSLADSRLSALMKSCYVVLQRAPVPSTLLNISRRSRKKRSSFSIRQNSISKSINEIHCSNGEGIRRSWASSSCSQQGSMITRSRKRDDV